MEVDKLREEILFEKEVDKEEYELGDLDVADRLIE